MAAAAAFHPMSQPLAAPSATAAAAAASACFDTEGAIFMGAQRDPAGCVVGLFGVPYDGTTSFRPGTRFGPAAIRDVSAGLESYCPQLDLDLVNWPWPTSGRWRSPLATPSP